MQTTNPLMKAVAYTLNHWDALVRFLEDPDFPVDNNDTEQAIKSWVLVRKNGLHVGSDAGGKAAAIHLSFLQSARNRPTRIPDRYILENYPPPLDMVASNHYIDFGSRQKDRTDTPGRTSTL